MKTAELISLTDQLLSFSKSLDILNETKKENICINEILEDVISCYYVLLKEKGIIPKISICTNKVIKKFDKMMLIRIFENILSNAVKYSDGDLSIILEEGGKITFSNSASKLDMITVEKIFDRYYTVENAKQSSGVGLSIARQLAELNHCTMNAKYENHRLFINLYFN